DRGAPVALGELSFPSLTAMRTRILHALIETSARPDAMRRLRVAPSMEEQVARNAALLGLLARPALEVYVGSLHRGLDAATLSPVASARAADGLIVASALWGALRPADRIPPYRLDICARLVGMDRLEPAWRTVLPDVLAAAAGGDGIVLDLRSPGYQAIGTPAGASDRTVTLRVRQHGADGRRIGDATAKRVRGQVARHLLESGADPGDADALAVVLGERWPVLLDAPPRPGKPWQLAVTVTA
ncbi:MAG: peroxide stress protein YaaA, partial [Candidatus Limnocylindrales bacterium]